MRRRHCSGQCSERTSEDKKALELSLARRDDSFEHLQTGSNWHMSSKAHLVVLGAVILTITKGQPWPTISIHEVLYEVLYDMSLITVMSLHGALGTEAITFTMSALWNDMSLFSISQLSDAFEMYKFTFVYQVTQFK